jgi:mRNA interferase MazF
LKRGELYRVYKGAKRDPKDYRVFVVVSRQALMRTTFSSVICAPVYSNFGDFPTQIPVGVNEGLKHDSAIFCDDLMSLPKSSLTNYIGTLSVEKMDKLKNGLIIALGIEDIEEF